MAGGEGNTGANVLQAGDAMAYEDTMAAGGNI